MTNKNKNKNKNKNNLTKNKTKQKSNIKTHKIKKGITKHYNREKVKEAVAEMKKAKAVKVSKEEYNQVITGKMVERVQMQKNYRGAYLFRRLKEERLRDMQARIKDVEVLKKEEVEWLGYYYGLNHIKANYDYELHEFRQAISNENYLKQGLVNLGFEADDLIGVLNGKYITDRKELTKREKKRENGRQNQNIYKKI